MVRIRAAINASAQDADFAEATGPSLEGSLDFSRDWFSTFYFLVLLARRRGLVVGSKQNPQLPHQAQVTPVTLKLARQHGERLYAFDATGNLPKNA